ncbi:PAS domain S-box protein [Archaeoglobus fulgidus]|uniref:PAS domain S-box protein n=1 Tax=Archaeoglobus fulgidus TaxID=2234 RepID=UPI000B34D2C1|nr:PAS domain S-box protein [Archaeoglobus fulgidus]
MDYMELVLENIRDGIFVIQNDVIVFATPSVKEAGYDISEVVGKKFIEFIWEGNREDVLKIIRSLTDGAECEIRALAKKKDGRAWIDARCKKVGEYLIVVARDVSRLVSLETLLRATLDILRHSPSEIDEVENILREYFDDASFSEKIQDFKIKVGEVTVPVRFQDRVLGSLKIQLPDWFEVTAEDMELFNVLGECVAKNMIMLESRRIIRSSLVAIKAASENLALLVDRIRNPLAAINGFVEVKVGGDVYEKVHEQVMAIEEIVKTLDDEWEKVDRLADKLSEAFSVLEKLGTTESQKINKKRKT